MRNVRIISILIILFCNTTFIAAESENTGILIDKIIEAYGGKQNVFSVKSYRLEATIHAHATGEKGKVIRVLEGPLKLKVLVRYTSGAEIRILDKNKAVRGFSPGTLASVKGPLRDSMVMQAARADIPWILDRNRSGIRVVKVPKLDKKVTILEFPFEENLVMRIFVDKKTNLIIRAETVSSGDMGFLFETEYSDFRKVGRMLFAFREENYASGAHTATTMVDKIDINPSGAGLELPVSK